MKNFNSIDIRPYQILCLICRQGCCNNTKPYYHTSRLNEIQTQLKANPIVPLTLRCNTETVYRYQNPGRKYDTPEGELYNDLRDLTILQRIGAVPGSTFPAIDVINYIFDAIPTINKICKYSTAEAPEWPQCRFADSGNYERGIAKGVGAIIPNRTPEEKQKVKADSTALCYQAKHLRIRPHHLLCMTCFYKRFRDKFEPIQEDNLYECIRVMQLNPDIPVELVHGPCMICPPCHLYHVPENLCIGGRSVGLRDDKKDLETLRLIGLSYGDVLPAHELLQRLYDRIKDTNVVCAYGDGVGRSKEWSVCGSATGEGKHKFALARLAGLGVPGVNVPPEQNE